MEEHIPLIGPPSTIASPPHQVRDQLITNGAGPLLASNVQTTAVISPSVKSESPPAAPLETTNGQSEELAAIEPLSPNSLLDQINLLGPCERCSPTQAGVMGKKLLTLIAYHEQNNLSLPEDLQSSFDILHRCLGVGYGTFFLNLYAKANAPCVLCHSCKCLYPPGQFIHHVCTSLPANIAPCRSKMWRRCLVPLVSPGVDKDLQKQRWKYVLEKFSHYIAKKNPIPPETEAQLLQMPAAKRKKPNKSEGKTTKAADLTVLEMEDQVESSLSPEPTSSALALAEQLVVEVRRLQKELALIKGKLEGATGIIEKMPSEACMREQLSQALSNQQTLTIERDAAREEAAMATERADKLQKQLDLIRKAHAQMERQLSN